MKLASNAYSGRGIRLEDVPDFRVRLLNIWRPGGPLANSLRVLAGQTRQDLWVNWSDEEMDGERRTLQHGALFWLTPNFRTLMDACIPTLPGDLGVGSDIPPPQGFGSGLVVVSEPMISFDYDAPENPIHIQAFSYQPIVRTPSGKAFLRIVFYAEHTAESMWDYGPVGVAEWEAGRPLDEERQVDASWDNDRIRADLELDRRRFAAFSLLANQTIADVTEHRSSRPVDRRCARAGVPSTVQVVRLRRIKGTKTEPESEMLVEWSHQWLVSGHWRNQACGPGLSERRWTFIAPYVKGPEDKPLILKDKVYAAVR